MHALYPNALSMFSRRRASSPARALPPVPAEAIKGEHDLFSESAARYRVGERLMIMLDDELVDCVLESKPFAAEAPDAILSGEGVEAAAIEI